MPASPVAIVSGSGIDLRPLADAVYWEKPFAAFPGLCAGQVVGHACRIVFARCGERPLILQVGRRHAYEGVELGELLRPVDLLLRLGARSILFTNSVGGLRWDLAPGTLLGAKAVVPWRFRRYSLPEMIVPPLLLEGCDEAGVFHWMHGPCYETRGEIEALKRLGGDVVGMSVAPELAYCAEKGVPAALISCVTNSCGAPGELHHASVLEVARRNSGKLCGVIRRHLEALD